MKTSHFARVFAVAFLVGVPAAQADLIPPGGEGVSECRNKKAGDPCENMKLEVSGLGREPGTCVEANLDHVRLKYKAHLRCVSTPVPAPSASAAPSASVVTTAPMIPSAVPSAPAPAPSAPPEAAKSGPGCSFTIDEPMKGVAFAFVALALGILVRRRRP